MTQEEKARAYDEALEKSKEFYILCKKCGAKDTVDFLEDSFPELKEESEDEKTERILHSISSKMSLHLCDIFTEEEFQCFDTWSYVWLEKQGNKDSQVTFPTFTFDDVLALQCCMETVKKVQDDKELYEKLNDIHSKVYDAYHFKKRG